MTLTKGRPATIRPLITQWVEEHPNTTFTVRDLVPDGLAAISSGYYKIVKDLVDQGVITKLDKSHYSTNISTEQLTKRKKRKRSLPDTIEFEVIAEVDDRIILRFPDGGDFFSARRIEL